MEVLTTIIGRLYLLVNALYFGRFRIYLMVGQAKQQLWLITWRGDSSEINVYKITYKITYVRHVRTVCVHELQVVKQLQISTHTYPSIKAVSHLWAIISPLHSWRHLHKGTERCSPFNTGHIYANSYAILANIEV